MNPRPSGYPYKTIPQCSLNDPQRPHSAGVLLVTAVDGAAQPGSQPFETRCCVNCLDAICEALKEGGFHSIRITAPEAPAYHAHLNFRK